MNNEEVLTKDIKCHGHCDCTMLGVRAQRDKSFPSSFTPLIIALLRILNGECGNGVVTTGASSTSNNEATLPRQAAQILSLFIRASPAFARFVYTVPKFISIYLKMIRSCCVSDVELSLKLLRSLQRVLLLEKKAALVVRLEGGVRTLMQCIANGPAAAAGRNSGGTGNSVMERAAATSAIGDNTLPSAASFAALSAAVAATSTTASSVSSGTMHLSTQQKMLRVLLEILLLVVKHNEHSSAAVVSQALPHLSNLLAVLRYQQAQLPIFLVALQLLEKLCKEKKVLLALMGGVKKSKDEEGNEPTDVDPSIGAPVVGPLNPTVPPPTPAVLALLSALGPSTTNFMTWCMVTLLHSPHE